MGTVLDITLSLGSFHQSAAPLPLAEASRRERSVLPPLLSPLGFWGWACILF